MTELGNGLFEAEFHEDALIVMEADLASRRRLGDSEDSILVTQSNLASTYQFLGRVEEALSMRRDVYSRCARLYGEEHRETLIEASNLANLLEDLKRFEEVRALFRRTMPIARRILGEGHRLTLKMRTTYARALYLDTDATLDDIREAVTTLDDVARIARRVLGGAHPITEAIEHNLSEARAALRSRETPASSA